MSKSEIDRMYINGDMTETSWLSNSSKNVSAICNLIYAVTANWPNCTCARVVVSSADESKMAIFQTFSESLKEIDRIVSKCELN